MEMIKKYENASCSTNTLPGSIHESTSSYIKGPQILQSPLSKATNQVIHSHFHSCSLQVRDLMSLQDT
jgi:hypothetical protein